MNLHAINPENKLFLIRATDDDNQVLVWIVEARNWDDAQRAYDILEKVHDRDYIHGLDMSEIAPNWTQTPDQLIAELQDTYNWVFEDDEEEDD